MAKNTKGKGEEKAPDKDAVLKSDNSTKLDAIKEIIFGQNMREYEEEFNEIRTHINSNLDAVSVEFSRIRKLMEEMEERLSAKMSENHKAAMDQFDEFVTEDYNKNIKAIMEKLDSLDEKKADRRKIGKMLVDIGNKLSS